VTGVTGGPEGAVVDLSTAAGRLRLPASFVIGADGAASTVRQALGVGFDGYTYPERFMIASTTVHLRDLIPDLADVNYVADPEQWVFILRTPESWRLVYPVPEEQSPAEATSPARLQAQFQRLAPTPPATRWWTGSSTASTSGWPAASGPAGWCSPATRRTSTARSAASASTAGSTT
jgi:2-polyprenyl-6-methoxyphenol hydroxylase-like FAD-dependent oxidoreductase